MKLIFVGPQGSGKGTQAKLLAEKLRLVHISAGDLLRGATGELKEEIEALINKGKMVSNELMIKILKEKLEGVDGFILDGFPRNLAQAEELERITPIDKVIEISISDEESVRRLGGRLNCRKCGAIFNSVTDKPKEEGKCDKCGGELYQRNDDKEEAIRERLKIYHTETEPILEKYDSVKIDGEQSIEKVKEDILRVLGKSI